MPFLGQDWRSPGECWVKSQDGWKRSQFYREKEEEESNINGSHRERQLCTRLQEESNDNKIVEDCEVAAKKRKKDHFNISTQSEYFYREKWIHVHKGSTKEIHGYCTLGEAFNRLDFSIAIEDMRRFNYVVKAAIEECLSSHEDYNEYAIELRNIAWFGTLNATEQRRPEKVVDIAESITGTDLPTIEVIENQQNPRLIKNLLQDLGSALCILVHEVGRCVLVGNINIWVYRMETILNWQHQLNNLKITRRIGNGVTLSDLPLHMQRSILHMFSDGLDIINLGQVTSTLHMLSEDRHLWKNLCQYHFSEKQFCRHLILTENGCVDWKLMYFTLQKYCPKKEQYGDSLQFCRHCSILFWKDTGHPCTANNPESCCTPVSPQHFIDLFLF
ncbi:F-box only protein 25 isoform X2 [Rhinoraja longicauda]